MEKSSPNYKQIFKDILDRKYPEKRNACENILNKTTLSIVDVIEINTKIFGKGIINNSQKFRSYKKSDILNILETDGKAISRPWFGQLMTGPQLMAYLCQVNMWLEKYQPKIKL